MYQLIVGTKNWSSWSLRPYLALRATGAPFTEITIALRRPETRAEIRKLAPSNRVPVLLVKQDDREFAVLSSAVEPHYRSECEHGRYRVADYARH